MIDAHRGAFEYDWRTRFHKSLRTIGRSMSWGEAYRLTERLFLDPSSHVSAAVGEWAHPVTWDAIVAMNSYDLTHQIAWVRGGKKGPRPEQYVRPWPNKVRKHLTPGKSLTQDEVLAALRAAGHDGAVPTKPA